MVADNAARGKVLRVGTQNAVVSLDPHRAHDFTSHVVLAQIFDAPYRRVGDRFEPVLVTGAPTRRDARTFEVVVDTTVRFSDGTPLEAEDVAAALRPGLAALDVTVSTQGAVLILQAPQWRHRVEDLLAAAGARVARRTDGELLGTGSFACESLADDVLRLVRNPHARRAPKIDGVEFRWFTTAANGRPEGLLGALERREIDFTFALSRDDVQSIGGVRKLYQSGMSTAFLAMNTASEKLADPEMRRIIARALDRQRLTEVCYSNAAAFVARSLLPPALGRGSDGIRHDLQAALAGLVGRKPPARLRMLRVWGPRPYLPRPDAVAAAVAEQLARIGITVDVDVARDGEDFATSVARGQYDLVLAGWVAETPDAVDYLEAMVSSAAIPGQGHLPVAASNYARWNDPTAERLLADARLGVSGALDGVLARIASEVPLVPLMHGPRVVVHAWRVKSFDPEASLVPDFAEIELGDA